MKGIDRLSVIRHKSEINKDWIHSDLFRILRKEDIWIAAYENIKGNKGALTPGVTKETLDGMSLPRLLNLRDKVVKQKYHFKPVNEIEIPKPDGRKRPLGLPTSNDKIVQEVIRMILEAIYEPCFSKVSFGFRQGLGTHDALEHIEAKFRWVDWVIEGDIEGAYPTIDHKQLCDILCEKIDDVRFINLIRKLLKCGILRKEQFSRSSLGVPQGSIVSPILANIYYNELDKWVEEKACLYNRSKSTLKSRMYKKLEYRLGRLTKKIKGLDKRSNEYKTLVRQIKLTKKERLNTPSLARERICIEYVRYADDWMIGIKGDQKLAKQLKTEVTLFIKERLKQSLHPVKTNITNLRAGKAKFLGNEIYLPRHRKISPYTGSGTRTTRRTNPRLRFEVPLDSVLSRMKERGYIKNLPDKGHRAISKASYTTLEDIVIVKHFSSVWRGLENYYSGCTNLSKLQYIHYLLHMSCAMTLSHRHRSTVRKIFAKHGKTLKVSNSDTEINFPYQTKWSVKDRKWQNKQLFIDPFEIYANHVSRSQLKKKCQICRSKDFVQMHHVKHVRKNGVRYGGFHKEMALLNRKQIPLCKKCHKKVHLGLYDNISLKNLQEA
jgi:group II intron reverse transcriptase/maturase